jgi:hypothetical protein
MADEEDEFALRVGRAAIGVWGDIPRDVQEALLIQRSAAATTFGPPLRGCCMSDIPAQNTLRSPV